MMNDLILYLYLIDIVSSIACVIKAVAVISVISLIAIGVYILSESYSLDRDDVKYIVSKYCKPIAITLGTASLVLAIIPSTQTMYTALGLYTANQAMQQPQMAQVGNQAMRILQAKLDEYEKELTQEKTDDTDN